MLLYFRLLPGAKTLAKKLYTVFYFQISRKSGWEVGEVMHGFLCACFFHFSLSLELAQRLSSCFLLFSPVRFLARSMEGESESEDEDGFSADFLCAIS